MSAFDVLRLALLPCLVPAAVLFSGCEAPDTAPVRLPSLTQDPGRGDAEAAWSPFGLQVSDLPEAAKKALGLSQGAMVTKVRAPANRTRLLPGDVIVAVDQQPVHGADDFNRLAARAMARRPGAVGLLVKRAESDLFIPLEPGDGRAASGAAGNSSRGGGAPRPDEHYRRRTPPIDTPLRT